MPLAHNRAMSGRWILALILVVFAISAVRMNAATPYRTAGELHLQRQADGSRATTQDVGAPDERQHANYVATVQKERSLPVFRPGSSDLYETYQSHQPPLYYILAAGWSQALGLDPQTQADGFRLRLFNTLLGLLTLVGIYSAARWGTGSETLALTAAALAGLMPMFVALHSAVSNDPLLILGCTWSLALMARVLREGWTVKLALALGLVMGLSLITKTTALVLLPVALILCWQTRESLQPRWVTALVFGLPLLIASPVWMRNMTLYSDPLAMRAFKEAFVGTAQRKDMMQMVAMMREANGLAPSGAAADYWVNWFGWWTGRSFVGAFGQMDVFFSATVYRVTLGLLGLCALGWLLTIRRAKEEFEPTERKFHILAATLVGLVCLLFLQFNLTYFQAQGRYLYPAIAAIAIGLSVGLLRWIPRSMRVWTPLALVLLMGTATWLATDYAAHELQLRSVGGER